ncbi:MAG: FAD-binding oxidoreductase, partial [Pseudomonadota bacterium]
MMADAASRRDRGGDLLAGSFKASPYWADDLAPLPVCTQDLPPHADVVVVGSGYTGLNAALELARGGRHTVVIDAGDPGAGCSTRNGGQVHCSIDPGRNSVLDRLGPARAYDVLSEGPASVDWLAHLIEREGIACDFARVGSFHAAHTPRHFEALARSIESGTDPGSKPAFLVPPEEMSREIGTDAYFGGVVHPQDGSLHPGRYHRGLLERSLSTGAVVVPNCAATAFRREGTGFEIETDRGRILCRDVAVATNGYT